MERQFNQPTLPNVSSASALNVAPGLNPYSSHSSMLMSLGGNISTAGQPRTRGEPKATQQTNTFTSAERK